MNSSFQQANQYRRVGCLEEAVIAYQKAIQSHPNFYWAYQKLGETLHQLARWDAAVTAFHQAIAVNPTARWSYFYLGQVLAQQQEWSEAIASYQKAIALHLTEPQVFWGLGTALEALKRWDEAIATYQKTIELNVNKYQSYQYLGNLLLRQRQWAEAVAAHKKAVQLNPKSSASKHNLGRALFYLGKFLAEQNQWSEAVDKYRQALDLGFDQGPVHYHLGKGLNQLGCYEEAVVELKQALEFNPLFLEWEQELEYALNQLGRTLATESTGIFKTKVSQPNFKNLNPWIIGVCLESPKHKHNQMRDKLLMMGWVLPKNNDVTSVKIIAKSAEYEQEELLSSPKPDVITKKLNTQPEGHPMLCCGFRFEVEPAEKIELYISIQGNQYHWKTIKTTVVAYKEIARIQQIWRNYINNNLKDISESDAEALQSLPTGAIERYIYGKPEVARRDSIKLATNYLDLSDSQRSYLEKFLDFTRQPEFCVNLVESALTHGFCRTPNPFGEGYAVCKQSFHLGAVTVLRFINYSRENFVIMQKFTSSDFIYFPLSNVMVNGSGKLLQSIIINFIRKFPENFNYTIKSDINKFGGIISSFGKPSHFYYDVCLGLLYLHKYKGLLNKVPSVIKYKNGNFFLLSSLFKFDKKREFEIQNSDIISHNSRAVHEFYIHIGSNGLGYKNLWDKEELSQMIVSTACELVDDQTAKEVKVARKCYPLLWFGVTVRKRSWVEQVEGGAAIITELAKIYPSIGVVFDGYTAPLNQPQGDIGEAAKDRAVVDEIVQLLPPSVRTFTVVGSTTVRKLAFATAIDVFIANKGTGSIHVDCFAKKLGVLHISNSARLITSRNQRHYNVVNCPINSVIDIPYKKAINPGRDSYSINPDVILNLVLKILAKSNP